MTSSTADVQPEIPPIHPEDPDDEWVTATDSGRSVRVQLVTGALLLLCVLGGGFWGGVVAEKHHGTGTTAASSLASRFAAARATGAGSGFTFGGGAAAAAATGTVIDVSGDTIDVTDTNGNLVKVIVGPTATVTRTAASSPSGLQVGDSVIVTGTPAANGTVSATAVRATAQGVAAGTGRAAGVGAAG
jgi:hypothetical protein